MAAVAAAAAANHWCFEPARLAGARLHATSGPAPDGDRSRRTCARTARAGGGFDWVGGGGGAGGMWVGDRW